MAAVISGNTIKLNNGQTVQGQENAWYDGQNFSGGKLGAAGVKISAGPGQGQTVSKEVVAQTNPSNVAFLGNLGDVQNHLNGVQNGVYSSPSSGGDIPGVQTADEIASDLKNGGLLPNTPAPTAPNLADTYTSMTSAAGVDKIQQSISDLTAQEDQITQQLNVNKQSENGKPVAQNVIAGRISEETQQAQDQLTYVSSQKARKVEELNSALTNIKTIMDFKQQDYSNAVQSYDTQFQQAISTINLIHGIQQDQKTDVQRAQDNARANAQIFINNIKDGSLDLHSLPADQQANLNKMEVQAGLPIGFFQSIKKDPKADIVATNDVNGQIQVLMRNPDGSMSLQKYGSQTNGGLSKADVANQETNATTNNAAADAKRGATLQDLASHYGIAGGLSLDEVLRIYNSNSPRGNANETIKDLKAGNYSTKKGYSSLG